MTGEANRLRGSIWSVIVAALAVASCAAPPQAPAPVAGIWYRGQPAGVPKQNDLAEMRALDFTSVTWPASQSAGTAEFTRQADAMHLTPLVRPTPSPLTPATALTPGPFADIAVDGAAPMMLTPLAWRAIAHGARAISFDPGLASGTGLDAADGGSPSWLAAAKTIARHIRNNAPLIASLMPGPPVTVDAPKPPDLDVVLLDADRSWMIIATNPSAQPVTAIVHLPAAVPYAMWTNMLDGSHMAMVSEPAGPRWPLSLDAFGAGVYLIDKTLK